jgi:predicted secreted acid phosphatase
VKLIRFSRPTRTATIAIASAAAGIALAVPGLAVATHSGQDVPAPPANPTRASQIQNIDQVKTAIKGYYGDTTTTVNDPVPNGADTSFPGDSATVPLHQFNPDGAYAHETEGIASHAGHYLARQAHKKHHGRKAILFDIDDTTLNTYSYEIYSNFVYNPTTNAYFVNSGLPVADGGAGYAHPTDVFPGVPGMADLENKAAAKGYTVFFLTGRPSTQLDGTLLNLRDAGYTFDDHNVVLKDLTAPWLQPCQTDSNNTPCTTTEYKSLTRKHIEQDLGYDIVANFGDQYSDLNGGFADRTFKLPNPMYFIG